MQKNSSENPEGVFSSVGSIGSMQITLMSVLNCNESLVVPVTKGLFFS